MNDSTEQAGNANVPFEKIVFFFCKHPRRGCQPPTKRFSHVKGKKKKRLFNNTK